MLSMGQENYTLAHQVRCLAMLFDYLMDEASPLEKKSTSVVDVGLCKPVIGKLLARSFRGRDRRKMISWKDIEWTRMHPSWQVNFGIQKVTLLLVCPMWNFNTIYGTVPLAICRFGMGRDFDFVIQTQNFRRTLQELDKNPW